MMKSVILRASIVAILAVLGSLLAVVTIVPALGGVVDGNAWLMCIVCPLVTAWPVSAYTFWQGDRLKQAHRDLARTHAQLAAAHRRLAEKASRDSMTGMLNREAFFATLDSRRREADCGALLIIDADHFKNINDSYGHLTGDKALLEIAGAISRGVRAGDVLGRVGGEEFAVLLNGATSKEMIAVAECIRREVERISFSPRGEETIPLTVSIGGTTCRPGATISDLMRRADHNLYEAKRGGRNLAVTDTNLVAAA